MVLCLIEWARGWGCGARFSACDCIACAVWATIEQGERLTYKLTKRHKAVLEWVANGAQGDRVSLATLRELKDGGFLRYGTHKGEPVRLALTEAGCYALGIYSDRVNA
jgi:hypothetical protein